MEGEGSTGKVKGLKHVSVVLKIGDCEISVLKKKRYRHLHYFIEIKDLCYSKYPNI